MHWWTRSWTCTKRLCLIPADTPGVLANHGTGPARAGLCTGWVALYFSWSLLCAGHPVCCRALSSAPRLSLPHGIGNSLPYMTTENVSRHYQMSSGEKLPPLRTTRLEEPCSQAAISLSLQDSSSWFSLGSVPISPSFLDSHHPPYPSPPFPLHPESSLAS